jgi:FixJ family two-component response regulator
VRQALETDARQRGAKAQHDRVETRLALLTAEERGIAERIALGHTNREIAAAMSVSLRTVQLRRTSLMKKLQLKTRAELVQLVLADRLESGQT